MSLRLSGRVVIPTPPLVPNCVVSVRIEDIYSPVDLSSSSTITLPTADNPILGIPINIKKCCLMKQYGKSNEVSIYIPQDSDRVFLFTDVDETTDFSGALAVTFDVWDSVTAGSTNQITKSLGSGILIPSDNVLRVEVENTDTNLSAGTYYFELWITDVSSDKFLIKYGNFVVEDTRKFDA